MDQKPFQWRTAPSRYITASQRNLTSLQLEKNHKFFAFLQFYKWHSFQFNTVNTNTAKSRRRKVHHNQNGGSGGIGG